MQELLSRLASDPQNQNYDYFSIGFMDSDKLQESVRSFNPREYKSRLYLVSFNKTLEDFRSLNGKVPYVEIGSL